MGFHATAFVDAARAGQYSVAIKNFVHFARAEKQIFTAIFRAQKTKTIAMREHLAFYQIRFVCRDKTVAAVLQ